ncbi:DUF3488 and transglutaminase-like domain-containing protein [soil metagenome]
MRSVIFLAGLLAAFAGLHVVVKDQSWWFVGASYAIVVIGAATLTRALTRRLWVPPLASLVASIIVLTAGYAPDTAVLGLLPTTDTLSRFGAVVGLGLESIAEQGVPADPEFGLVFLLVILVIGCALVGDAALAVKAPALTALPLLTILAVPVTVRPELADPTWFVITAIAFLLLLRTDRRATSVPVALAAGALVVIGSLVVPQFLPKVNPADAPVGTGVATGINPLINLGNDLRRGEAITALQYTSNSNQGLYLRLATLDTFNGRSWSPAIVNSTTDHTVDAFGPPSGLRDDVLRLTRSATVKVGAIAGRWLPLPYPATSVKGLTGSWYWEAQGLSARSTDSSVGGQQYDVQFLDVQPTLEQVQVSLPDETSRSPYVALPQEMPSVISETAHTVTAEAVTSYDKAIALQSYFQSGAFTYSEEAPVEGGYDGTGADIIATFLDKKSGYCVHFASAMAVMARTLGIPSRVAVGFQPGQTSPDSKNTIFTVSSDDLHAWPELYFDSVGWLRFEPTPGRGEIPDYSTPAVVDDPSTPENEAATPAPTTSAAPAASAGPKPDALDPDTGLPVGQSAVTNPVPYVLLGMLSIVLLAGLAPLVIRTVIRSRRYRALQAGDDAGAAAWDELRDTARDHGWAAPDTETPRDFAERLAVVLVDDRETIGGFRGDVELSAFARPGTAVPSVQQLRDLRRAIGETVPFRARLRALFLPASLMTRFRWDPDA